MTYSGGGMFFPVPVRPEALGPTPGSFPAAALAASQPVSNGRNPACTDFCLWSHRSTQPALVWTSMLHTRRVLSRG